MIQAIVFLPLIGALIAGLLGRTIGHRPSEYITTGLLLIAAVLSWVVFLPVAFGGGLVGAEVDGHTAVLKVEVMRWIQVGDMDLRWILRVDTLTAIMLVVVNTVSASCTSIPSATWPTIRIATASLPICRSSPSPC